MTPPPARVAALLGHGVSEALAARLLASPRLVARIGSVLDARLGPLPALDPAQARALPMDAVALGRLQLQAGAVFHGNAIAAMVDGPAVRALNAAIGEGMRTLALQGRHLARPTVLAAPEVIAAALPGVGAACLADWCARQPGPVSTRVALQSPPGAWPPSQAGGAAIIAWLLERA